MESLDRIRVDWFYLSVRGADAGLPAEHRAGRQAGAARIVEVEQPADQFARAV